MNIRSDIPEDLRPLILAVCDTAPVHIEKMAKATLELLEACAAKPRAVEFDAWVGPVFFDPEKWAGNYIICRESSGAYVHKVKIVATEVLP